MAARGSIGFRNITFITDNTTDDDSSVGQSELGCKPVVEEDTDGPVVFQCGQCKLPVGDSLSWVGSEHDLNQILLKCVTENVVVGTEPFVSRTPTELGCLIVNLSCLGCSSPLGRVYTSTPRNFDYKRSLFCLSVENVECYVIGSSTQKYLEDEKDEPVTLELRAGVDMEIGKIKALVVSMAQRLHEMEVKLQQCGKK